MNWQPPQYGQPPQQPNAAQPGYGAPPQGAPGPYVPPGQAPPQQPPPGYGAPPQQGYPGHPNNAPPPGYGAPPAQPGYGAPPAQPGYGAPPAQPGYGAPPQGYGPAPAPNYGAPPQGYGQAPQMGGPVAFNPAVTSLDTMNDPDLPYGSHIVVGTGMGGSAAGGKMFRVELKVEKSNNPQAIGQVGNYKVWLDRAGLQGGATAHAQAASKDFAVFVVPASGRQLKDTDLATANNLVGEFANRMTIEGRPLTSIRLGVDVKPVEKKKKKGEFFAQCTFTVLPPGA